MTYSPSYEVRSAHHIPHLSTSFQIINPEFSLNTTSLTSNTYLASLLPLPAFLLALGLLALLIFVLLILFRCCCTCMKCQPTRPDEEKSPEVQQNWRATIESKRKAVLAFFIIFLVFTILADHSLYFGNANANKGVSKGSDALDSLATIFTDISTYSNSLSDSSASISTSITNVGASCTIGLVDLSTITSSIDSVSSATGSIADYVGTIPDKLNIGKDYLNNYGADKKDLVMFIFYAFIMFVLICYIIGSACKSRIIMQGSILISFFIVLALTIICPIIMFLVMLLADMCMDPANNIISLIPSEDAQSILMYYSECTGTNPIGDYLNQTTVYTTTLNNTLYSILDVTPGCASDSDFKTAITSLSTMTTSLVDLLGETQCDGLAEVWDLAMNQGVCTYLFSGFYIIWIALYVTSGALFLCMCVSLNLCDYFGDYWAVSKDDPDAPKTANDIVINNNGQQTQNIDGDVEMQAEMPGGNLSEVDIDYYYDVGNTGAPVDRTQVAGNLNLAEVESRQL